MKESFAVRDALRTFYERFSSYDPYAFEEMVATGDGISVIGTAPGEGHDSRESWVQTYKNFIAGAGPRLEGGSEPRAWEEGSVGFAVDQPRFVSPDGSFIRTRLTAVLHQEYAEWKVVHLHFSVGVPDEDALTPPGS